MLSEILLETLTFLDRSSLEACQLVSRSYLEMIEQSNAGFALRPMTWLVVHCAGINIAGVAKFLRFASDENAEDGVYLTIGTDWNQPQAIAEEIVTRTRNMCIGNIRICCVTCASPLIALWRDAFNDRTPCRVAEVCMGTSCALSVDTCWQQILQPFAASKLRVERYELFVIGSEINEESRAKFDTIWSAWDRPTAQRIKLDLHGMDGWSYFLERLLREPEHGGRHFTVEGTYSSEVLQMVESYAQKFDVGGGELNFPTSFAFYRFERTNRVVHKLRIRPIRTLDKPPKRNLPDPKGLAFGDLLEESPCDVYEICNFARLQTMRAYFWVATRRRHLNTGVTDEYFHCHWFTVVPF